MYASILLGTLVNAVEAVLTDSGFKVDSPDAAAALNTAGALLDWCKKEENSLVLKSFSKYLTSNLKPCLGKEKLSLRTRKSRMWGHYHQLRTSEKFAQEWKDFLTKSVGSEVAIPAFFQFVTDKVFKDIIKQEFELNVSRSNACCEMTYDDQCATRYIAGYVCRKVRDRLESTRIPHKNDLIITLYEFRGNGVESVDASEDWVDTIDRGGLWHVTDEVYVLFCCIEEEIRRHFTVTAQHAGHEGFKDRVIQHLKENEDVLFQWCILSIELDDELSLVLLNMILELYVTIRGHAFANSCMELYKQHKKKTLQKAKAVRRKVYEAQNEKENEQTK